MAITYEEFLKNPEKYLKIAETDKILLINKGRVYVHMYNPNGEKLKAMRSKGCDLDDEDLNR
mgnify:CR=1 FL=1